MGLCQKMRSQVNHEPFKKTLLIKMMNVLLSKHGKIVTLLVWRVSPVQLKMPSFQNAVDYRDI